MGRIIQLRRWEIPRFDLRRLTDHSLGMTVLVWTAAAHKNSKLIKALFPRRQCMAPIPNTTAVEYGQPRAKRGAE